jgi:hypothetical protein
MHLGFGINILADINSISTHCQRLKTQLDTFLLLMSKTKPTSTDPAKNSGNASKTPEKPALHNQKQIENKSTRELYYWDVNRATFHGTVTNNHKQLSLNILTGTTPYDRNSLKISFENIHVLYKAGSASLLLNNTKISRLKYKRDRNSFNLFLVSRNVTLFRLPKLECTVDHSWGATNNYTFFLEQERAEVSSKEFESTELEFVVKINLPLGMSESRSIDDHPIERIVGTSTSGIMHYEAGTVEELINLPQLRHEYLLLHGIKPAKYSNRSVIKKRTKKRWTTRTNIMLGSTRIISNSFPILLMTH